MALPGANPTGSSYRPGTNPTGSVNRRTGPLLIAARSQATASCLTASALPGPTSTGAHAPSAQVPCQGPTPDFKTHLFGHGGTNECNQHLRGVLFSRIFWRK